MCLVCMVLFAPENYLNETVSGEIWLWVRSEFCCFLFLSLLIPSLACAWIIPSLSFAHKCFSALYTLYSVHKLDFFLSLCVLLIPGRRKQLFSDAEEKKERLFMPALNLHRLPSLLLLLLLYNLFLRKTSTFPPLQFCVDFFLRLFLLYQSQFLIAMFNCGSSSSSIQFHPLLVLDFNNFNCLQKKG